MEILVIGDVHLLKDAENDEISYIDPIIQIGNLGDNLDSAASDYGQLSRACVYLALERYDAQKIEW